MKFKKQIAIVVTCAVVLAGIFITVSYIGKGNETSKNNDSKITSDQDKNNIANTNDNSKQTVNTKDDIKEGIYTIKKDDTLYSIARTYMPNHNAKDIIEGILDRNSMTDKDPIIEGKEIIIPYEVALETQVTTEEKTANHENHIQYTVKSGDTLYKIAKETLPKIEITKAIKEIKEHNNIENENTIKSSQVICIPQQ